MTHSTSSSDACSLSIMFGIAMFTIVRSSRVMKNPSEITIRMTHGFVRLIGCAASAATAVLRRVRGHARPSGTAAGDATC